MTLRIQTAVAAYFSSKQLLLFAGMIAYFYVGKYCYLPLHGSCLFQGGTNVTNREKPRRVFLRCNILALQSVDCALSTFHLEAHVTARWQEPELDGVQDDVSYDH